MELSARYMRALKSWQYVPLHRPGSKFLKEAVSKLQWRALTVSACNAVGPPYRPFMSWDRSTDAWTTLEATTAFIETNARRQVSTDRERVGRLHVESDGYRFTDCVLPLSTSLIWGTKASYSFKSDGSWATTSLRYVRRPPQQVANSQ